MTTIRKMGALCALSLLGTTVVDSAAAQGLAQRIESAPAGLVQFNFAARQGVCGNGRTFISIGGNSWYGTVNDATRQERCEPGPVRVVMNRAGGDIVSIQTYVGPAQAEPNITDVGTVPARDAAAYLLDVAARAQGKPSHDAIFPATLADSADLSAGLLAVAKDRNRPRETRRTAISYLGREVERGNGDAASVTGELVRLATDGNDNSEVRKRAVSVLAGLDRGQGIPSLIQLSSAASDPWLTKEAMTALARSGDPRARDYLREALRNNTLAPDVQVAAIRGLGREYATASDAQYLRDLYPRLTTDDSKEAVLSALGDIGGGDNSQWLLSAVRNEQASADTRRRALQAARKAGASTTEMVQLYDQVQDANLKSYLISIYGSSKERAATDKLIAIARAEPDRTLRRRAISRLSRSDDPRVKDVLREIVEK
jgi:HEAT repeat protein